MQIQRLRFRNLNSLYDTWSIDLTAPIYSTDGLFAITGPTGSGKTTILDAITLALYGRTPRLARINASTNELLSRSTGDCFSEVTFSTREGTYTAHFSQHRARRHPEGKLAQAKHELFDALTGEILSSSLSSSAQMIEEKTGMNFDRFTRSMMLAQGSFAAFLQATPAERAPILEQITGTEIYSDISIAVHERRKEILSSLERQEAELKGVSLLSEDEREVLEQQRSGLKDVYERAQKRMLELERQRAWYEDHRILTGELQELEEQRELIVVQESALQPKRTAASRAAAARKVSFGYSGMTAAQETVLQLQDRVSGNKEERGSLDQEEQELKQGISAVLPRREDAQRRYEEIARLAVEVRAVDLKISERSSDAREKQSAHTQLQQQFEKLEAGLKAVAAEKEAAESQFEHTQQYLQEHREDAALASQIPLYEKQLKELQGLKSRISELSEQKDERLQERTRQQKRLDELKAGAEHADRYHSALEQEISELQQQLEAALAGRELQEYRRELEQLRTERELRQQIRSLEEHREHLIPGAPCPLCGSCEHPYADGSIPAVDDLDRKIEHLKKVIESWEQTSVKLSDRQKELLAASTLAAQQNTELSELERVLAAADSAEGALQERIDEASERAGDLESSFPANIIAQDLGSALDQMRAIAERWQQEQDQYTEISARLAQLKSSYEKTEARKDSLKEQIDQLVEDRERLAATLGGLRRQRYELFADKDPDVEQKRSEDELKELQLQERSLQERRIGNEQKRDSARKRCDELAGELVAAQSAAQESREEFEGLLQLEGFSDAEDFLSAVLPEAQMKALEEQIRSFEVKRDENKIRIEDRRTGLERLGASAGQLLPEEELAGEHGELSEQLQELQQRIGAAAQQLNGDADAREHASSLLESMELIKKDLYLWDRMHQLIGSADGKKFRNYAQGVTFEIMVAHANIELRKLSDRYLLLRDQQMPLELNVADGYQAGEVRSVKNLSGGESFLVSLALALGLSRMTSPAGQVDSLFLDEGFGTLDEQTLEAALDALASLRQHGKTIGIISHVGALQDRVAAKIVVERDLQGKSTISGPGCRKED